MVLKRYVCGRCLLFLDEVKIEFGQMLKFKDFAR
jgi:hypothetical protein